MTMEYGTITGRLVAAVADTIDDIDGNPDIVPISGTVTFTPSVSAIVVASDGLTVVPSPIVAQLDGQGYVALNGQQGVTVLATDSRFYNPNGWTYRVSFDQLAANGRRVTFDSYSIKVPAGTTVDLSSVTPIPSSTGEAIVRGPKGDTGPQGPQGDPGPSDTQVATYFTSPSSTRTAADTRYAQPGYVDTAVSSAVSPLSTFQRRAGYAVIGDSITAYNQNVGNAWHKALGALAGKLRHRGWFATGGYTLEQIETIHLPSVLAMSPLPGACIIAGGTNNLGATSSSAGGAYNPITSRATLMRIVAKLQAVGIMPILWCPPPRDDSPSVNALTQQWNAYIRYTAQRLGVPYVDAYNAVVDPTTGKYQAAAKLDDVHPNTFGHYLIGRRAAIDPEFLRRFNNDTPHLSTDILDAANLIPTGRGLFNQGVNGATVPTGWGAFGGTGTAFTLSQSAATAPAVGNWQAINMASGMATGTRGLQYLVPGTYQAGDRVALAVRVKSATPDDGLSGAPSIYLEARSSNVTVASNVQGGFGGTWEGIMWVDVTLPANIDTLRVNLQMSATNSPTSSVSVQFAQATLVNLTALESS